MSRANDIVLALVDRLGTIDGNSPYTVEVAGVFRGFTTRWKQEQGIRLYLTREELAAITPGALQQSRARLEVDVWVVGQSVGDNAAAAAEVMQAMEDVVECIWQDMYLGGTLTTYGGRIHPGSARSDAELSEANGRYIGVVTLICTYQPTSR